MRGVCLSVSCVACVAPLRVSACRCGVGCLSVSCVPSCSLSASTLPCLPACLASLVRRQQSPPSLPLLLLSPTTRIHDNNHTRFPAMVEFLLAMKSPLVPDDSREMRVSKGYVESPCRSVCL